MANTNTRSNGVTVDSTDVALLHTQSVGRGPISDLATDGEVAVVTNFADNTVAVLDAESLIVRTGAAAGQPFAVTIADGRAFVAVSSASDDAIAVVDTDGGRVIASYPMTGTVTALTANADGKRVFAARSARDGVEVAVLDVPAERVSTIDIAQAPDATIDALRVDAAGRRLFVATSDSTGSRIIVVDVDRGRVRRTFDVGAPIRGIELGPDGTAYVLTSDITDRGVLHVIDLVTNRVAAVVDVGSAPVQLALSDNGTRAFVVDYDRVFVVCTETRSVVGAIAVGARPACVAVHGDRLFVADYAGGVSSFAITAPAPMRYAQFVAAHGIAAAQQRELSRV